jgi:hypothetical protein
MDGLFSGLICPKKQRIPAAFSYTTSYANVYISNIQVCIFVL